MADPSLPFDSTSNPLKQENDDVPMVVEGSMIVPRRPWSEFPKLEEVESKYKDLIVNLPYEQKWWMRRYSGFWVWERILPGFLRMQEGFMPRPDDVIVASYPKSGTTWLKSLVFSVVHRNKYDISSHPLLKFSPHDCVHQLEYIFTLQDEQYLKKLISPRVFGTHIPYSLLSESTKTSKCPIIYICREPKDVVVSFWYMLKTLGGLTDALPFAQFFELFCEGRVLYGPMWDHVPEYYNQSLQNPNKIMFLRYEELMNDPTGVVIQIADFVGIPFSAEEVKEGVVEGIVRLCSFDRLKNLDVNKKSNEDGFVGLENYSFFRKAVVGDWQNHMTLEMAAKLDEIVEAKLQDSGFSF